MINIAHYVKCAKCGQTFNRDKCPAILVGARRYAHQDCASENDEKLSKELQDKKELEEYIIHLLKIPKIDARIQKQIKKYVDEYNYTYSGMKKALIYFYEVQGHSIEKANGGVGIIPYIYTQAFNYYYALWEAQQKNVNKDVEAYIPKVRVIHIKEPQIKIKKRKMFSFLDEEE